MRKRKKKCSGRTILYMKSTYTRLYTVFLSKILIKCHVIFLSPKLKWTDTLQSNQEKTQYSKYIYEQHDRHADSEENAVKCRMKVLLEVKKIKRQQENTWVALVASLAFHDYFYRKRCASSCHGTSVLNVQSCKSRGTW